VPDHPRNGGVVITGASTGIGRACALHLDRLGFDVFAGVRRDADAERLRADASGHLRPLSIDVTDSESIAAAAREVDGALAGGGIVGLVNNAGVAIGGPLEFIDLAELRRQLEINVVGAVAVTQAFLPALRRRTGRVVNIGSVGGRVASPFIGPYVASKGAIAQLTSSLRQELRPWGMWAAVIEPGSVATPIWEKGNASADETMEALPEEGRRLYGSRLEKMPRVIEKTAERAIPPERVAEAVAHALTSGRPKARYLVGRDAQAQVALQRALPTRRFDALVARLMES
jgi:NAD(P)-dependent dehydrogenase (short-subunit alcohol dehydrogenase family)